MRSLELFAGAGGLAIGMAQAGFEHAAVIERDHDACETFRENQRRNVSAVAPWPVHECDVRSFDFQSVGAIDVISGGPPCQPFSLGGKHLGHGDARNMFPEALRAVRGLRPKAFIFENVKGLLRQSFADFFEYVYLQLTYPSIIRRSREQWHAHRCRLESHHTGRAGQAEYKVVFRLLNAADFGVPQRRERVFIVGFRSDLGIDWSFPSGAHSESALLRDQWIEGGYWERHGVARKIRPAPGTRDATRVRRLLEAPELAFGSKPWRTVRDAVGDLPDPTAHAAKRVLNHLYVPGARAYPGHTGSPYDAPAKTLKAGDHGVPGGENMVVMPNGSLRYFTVREAARIQTFPDEFAFCGPWTEAMRQLGNAVPVRLAEVVAASVAGAIRPSAK